MKGVSDNETNSCIRIIWSEWVRVQKHLKDWEFHMK